MAAGVGRGSGLRYYEYIRYEYLSLWGFGAFLLWERRKARGVPLEDLVEDLLVDAALVHHLRRPRNLEAADCVV